MSPSDADLIFDAVGLPAATGRGFVRDMRDDAGTLALYVGRHIAFFERDADSIRVLQLRTR